MRALLRHLFTPHHTNNHRARVLHVDALFLYVLLFVVYQFAIGLVSHHYPDVLGYATDIRVDQLLTSTNAKRQENGLTPLKLNDQLSAAAAKKAADMFAKNYWAHTSPTGATPWDFIIGSGYHYNVAGENLAKNFFTSGGVVDAWMNSPSHRDNMLKSSYRDVGFAVVNGVLGGEETTLVVQMFGSTNVKPVVVASPPVRGVSAQVQQTPAIVVGEGVSHQVTVAGLVLKQPVFDRILITRALVAIFLGFFLSILVLDAWIVARRKIVRVSGHTIAHFVFLAAMAIAATFVARGAIL